MAFEIPEVEPERVTAGDTWEWKRTNISDFPADDGWTLYYRFKHPINSGFGITSTADGKDHSITVAATTSAAYTAGLYGGVGWMQNAGGEKFTVWHGQLTVELNFRAGTDASGVLDGRTDSRIIFDQLIAAYKAWTISNGQIKSYVIGDRSVTYGSQAEILSQISFWEIRVKNEEAAERLRSGERGGKRLMVRL